MEETQKHCLVEGCDRKLAAKGYCMTHYQQARKGTLVQAGEPGVQQSIAESVVNEPMVETMLMAITPALGVVTKEVVTTEVLRWQLGDRSVPIEELNREDLLGAARSLFETNGKLRAEFDKEMGEIADAYEQKLNSLHYVLAAHVELELREAMRDKMDMILEVVTAEVERRQSITHNVPPEAMKDKMEETDNGH